MSESPEIEIGGIWLRFVNGFLQRRWSKLDNIWHDAIYTSVAPDEAEAYAAFVRAHRDASIEWPNKPNESPSRGVIPTP